MAEQNAEVHEDASGQPPPVGANGNGAADAAVPDLDTLRAELDKTKRALGNLLNEKKRYGEDKAKLTSALKAWNEIAEEHHIEPDQLRERLTAWEQEEVKQAQDKGDTAKLLEKAEQRRQRDLTKKDEEIKRLLEVEIARRDKVIEAITIDHQLKAELDSVLENDPGLKRGATAILRPQLKAISDDGNDHGIRVVAMVGDDEVPLKDYVKNWIENDPEAWPYLAKNKSAGGGVPPGGRPGAAATNLKRSKMDAKAKSDFINAHGLTRYNALPL